MKKLKIGINRYGVIDKQEFDSITLQNDIELTGVCHLVAKSEYIIAGCKLPISRPDLFELKPDYKR